MTRGALKTVLMAISLYKNPYKRKAKRDFRQTRGKEQKRRLREQDRDRNEATKSSNDNILQKLEQANNGFSPRTSREGAALPMP